MQFKELLGKTIINIGVDNEYGSHPEQMTLFLSDDSKVILYHDQDCCEDVWLEDVVGNLDDLIDSPLLMAEESSTRDNPSGSESSTWTFYLLATVKGFVTLRWIGESNGYYSEDVAIRVEGPEEREDQ